jgi:hypothetical protein
MLVLKLMASSFDPIQFKIAQRQNWNRVVEGWKQWYTVYGLC